MSIISGIIIGSYIVILASTSAISECWYNIYCLLFISNKYTISIINT